MAVNYQEPATGKYYEELEPGTVYRHAITRTVTEADNLLFRTPTCNMAWLHLDDEYCKTTESAVVSSTACSRFRWSAACRCTT